MCDLTEMRWPVLQEQSAWELITPCLVLPAVAPALVVPAVADGGGSGAAIRRSSSSIEITYAVSGTINGDISAIGVS